MSDATAVAEETAEPTGYDALSDDVKAVMDRAVRISREEGWCGEFSRIAARVFQVEINDVVDSAGFSCNGYNRAGYDESGFDRNGRDKDGYDYAGRDTNGRDREGYDRYGLNAEGLDRQGRDKYRFDANGYDSEGYDGAGNRARQTRQWYIDQAAKGDDQFKYDPHGYLRPEPAPVAPEKKRRGLWG